MGAARDIVESVCVPRFWFSDFPLGHSAGKPFDPESQRETLKGALDLLHSATNPGDTRESPQRWSDDDSWKADFMDISRLSPAHIARLKAQHEQTRAVKTRT